MQQPLEDEDDEVGRPATLSSTVRLEKTPAGTHSLSPRFKLSVVEGPDAGAAIEAAGELTRVGSAPCCDLALSDRTASRFHFEICAAGDHHVLENLGSTNGTILNGVRVVEAYLSPGASIALGKTRLRWEPDGAQVRTPLSEAESFGAMTGRSVAMRAAFAMLERAAQSDVTVLLNGETGTGKELAAEAVHATSTRRAGPFIVVDCGAIPPGLIESELFGHSKGAFTGAAADRAGAFEAAGGGTIFLDEVGELPLELQPRLLRALERREVKRIGETRHVAVDVRVIAATHRDLKVEVNARRFRADLYYRLAVLEIRLPPLRERPDDVPVLIDRILAGLGASGPEADALKVPAFTAELSRHGWPGNIRELRNHLERCLALRAPAPPADLADAAAARAAGTLKAAREAFERQYLERLLAEEGGNVTRAARAAGVDRAFLYRLLWRNGLR